MRLVCCSVEEVDRLWVCEPDVDGDVFEADGYREEGEGGGGDWTGRRTMANVRGVIRNADGGGFLSCVHDKAVLQERRL